MPIPASQGPGKSYSILLELDSSQDNVDVFAALSHPVDPLVVVVHVFPSVVIGSWQNWIPAMNFTGRLGLRGFHEDTVFYLINEGRIVGRAGDGGVGASNNGFSASVAGTSHGGGGGGGAGAHSAGGTAESPATNGTAGTESAVGTGGANGTGGVVQWVWVGNGGDAGNAIAVGDFPIEITNGSGEIWGGGGGGHGGDIQRLGLVASDGGLPGVNGDVDGVVFLPAAAGQAGKAIDGTNVTFVDGGSDPNVKGDVG